MNSIRQVGEGVDVLPLLWLLQANPQLWDTHTTRTEEPGSPHYGLSDIWVRYCDVKKEDPTKPHDAVWYESPILRCVKDLVYPLMAAYRAERLGGVLITKIPAGKRCKPHVDDGWHAAYYEKFAIQIQSSPGQYFCFENEKLETHPGDVFWFDNSQLHWVENDTAYDRITLIVCLRREV